MPGRESPHHEEHIDYDGEHIHHYIETPRNKSFADFIGLKEVVTLLGFAVTVGMAWSNLSGKQELIEQRLQYIEAQALAERNQLRKDLEEILSDSEKAHKRAEIEIEKLLDRVRESEDNIRRLWRDLKK